jgi:glutathione S-transferase
MAKVKLHRCSWTFLHVDLDACWKVQKALDEQGVDYEVVKHGYLRGKRPEVVELSGQKLLPVIELEDGTAYRAESSDMAARVRAGGLADPAAG